ncbi:MAG TPA: hypothetical protein VK549_09685 [Acidimicrobiia bacterium]|nr:hypothetical protein [Acidimicrobiia bacterium]
MVYTAEKPATAPCTATLRERIPGWGADLDPADRPAVPREQFVGDQTGAHWDLPEQQPESRPRERSVEHERLTPVFGTAQPLRGASGQVRRYAYRYGEGRAAHWLLLVAGDRIDAVGNHVRSLFTLRPDNPVTQTGTRAEFTHHGIRSRTGTKRADLPHQLLDPIVIDGPWLVAVLAAGLMLRKVVRRARR